MLMQYTPISALTAEQQARLRARGQAIMAEGQRYVVFEGNYISSAELSTWLGGPPRERQQLNG